MATVIDELIVTLGLDPKNFSKGQKDAGDSLLKLKKDAQQSTKEIGEYLDNLRSGVVRMFAAFTAGRGIKDFLEDTAKANNYLSRLSYSLGESTQEMSLWRNAGQLIGSSADDITGSIAGMTQELQNFVLTGQSSTLPFLRAMGQATGHYFKMIDSSGRPSKATDLFKYLAEYAEHEPDKARAATLFRDMGVNQGMINLILQGDVALNKYLDLAARFGVVTEKDAKAARDLQTAWMAADLSSSSLGRTLETEVAPVLIAVAKGITTINEIMRDHPALLNSVAIGLGIVSSALTVLAIRAGIAWLAITGPVGWVLAAIAAVSVAIGLLADDWITFEKGGKSALGGLWTVLDGIWKLVKDIGNLIAQIFVGKIADVKAAWHTAFDDIYNDAKIIFGKIAHLFRHPFVDDATGDKKPVQSNPPSNLNTPAKKAAWDAAMEAEKKYNVPAAVSYAQWQLESANGTRMPPGSNNPFGIKARAGLPYVEAQTKEFLNGQWKTITARFAKFASLADAFDAHAKLLATSPAYAKAQGAKTASDYAGGLGAYATDPNYVQKLKGLIAANGSGGGGSTSTSRVENNVGTVNVFTQATDARGISREIGPAISDNLSIQANNGSN